MADTNQQQAAAEKRRAAHEDPQRHELLSALEVERRGYVQRGLDDRVAQVDQQIADLHPQPKSRKA